MVNILHEFHLKLCGVMSVGLINQSGCLIASDIVYGKGTSQIWFNFSQRRSHDVLSYSDELYHLSMPAGGTMLAKGFACVLTYLETV